jgi:hypothetical protein
VNNFFLHAHFLQCTFLERFKKILSRSLGAIPYSPGVGGIQNVGQNPEEQSVNLTLTFIDEQSINTLVFCL